MLAPSTKRLQQECFGTFCCFEKKKYIYIYNHVCCEFEKISGFFFKVDTHICTLRDTHRPLVRPTDIVRVDGHQQQTAITLAIDTINSTIHALHLNVASWYLFACASCFVIAPHGGHRQTERQKKNQQKDPCYGGGGTPFWALFFSMWLGDTRRASEPPVPCGHRPSFVLFNRILGTRY